MCGTCGCGPDHGHEHHHHDGHEHDHHHHDHHACGHDHGPNGHGAEESDSAAQAVERRRLKVEQDLLQTNDRHAQANRGYLDAARVFAINLMSSPGAGKTTLLCRTLEALRGRFPLAVVEGDQQTDNDAARIRATGVPAHQVNTGKGCHLDAPMLMRSFEAQPVPAGGVLFVENVGNLVCPASFDLGEHKKVVVVSVTEGEDKPLKYPDMFAVADLIVVNKIDLVPYLSIDVSALCRYAAQINSKARILQLSATSGTGMDAWIDWIESGRRELDGESVQKRASQQLATVR